MIRWFSVILAAVAWIAPAGAQTPICDELTSGQRQLADKILDSEYLYDCCDDTISACLAEQPPCDLARRLADNVCRRVAAGQDETGIRRALSRRARSMVGGGAPAEIDLEAAYVTGPDDAPVTVVIYACARCPYCSKLIPELFDTIENGPLHDRVRLAYRVFPIRGHEGSTPAGLAFVAAGEMGAFWPFMLHAYGRFDDWFEDAQPEWASAVGLDRADFEARMTDPATREALVASKKEGLVNGVEATPTFFINGRRWVGDLEPVELVDALEEAVARAGGQQ
jgi:protein-disulfide isomerase